VPAHPGYNGSPRVADSRIRRKDGGHAAASACILGLTDKRARLPGSGTPCAIRATGPSQ